MLAPGAWPRASGRCGPRPDRRPCRRLRSGWCGELRALPGAAPVGGSTAQYLDQKHTLGSRIPLAIVLLCVVTFLLLFAATRSLVLPLKALLMNALTLAATFGILVFVFQDGRLEGLLGYRARARSS